MYAPKFRSWMTDEERREEGYQAWRKEFDADIDAKATALLADVRKMAQEARDAIFPKPPENPFAPAHPNLAALMQQAALNDYFNAARNVYPQGAYNAGMQQCGSFWDALGSPLRGLGF